jgi:DNA-binding transcriptional MerR regulator
MSQGGEDTMIIAEVAKKYGLTPDTLRYYERVGLLPNVRRTSGGIRDYSEEDCRWVEYIKCMRSAGVSVETLIEYVRLFHEGSKTIAARKKLLLEQREQIVARIDEMNAVLAKLDWKLDGYEERMLKFEEEHFNK